MENIIKKAIDGGYNKSYITYLKQDFLERKYLEYDTILDPLFWQAVGKSCGWDTEGKIKTITAYKHFFQRNWQKGWNHAVKYLENLITNPSHEAEK